MERDLLQGVIAVAAAAAVASGAWRLGALNRGGAVAATVVGGTVLGFGGFGAAVVLVVFFVSASALSALPGGRDGDRSRRGARQVLANGSLAALAAGLTGASDLAILAFLGATATATADTWATEIGVRLGRTPRSILTLHPQAPGTSGAVSLPGTLASALGALAVAAAGRWLIEGVDGRAVASVAMAGLAGSIVDSLLGAGIQASYRCSTCGATPEVAAHGGCPVPAKRVAGLPGLDNDVVNWISTAAGAAAAVLFVLMVGLNTSS